VHAGVLARGAVRALSFGPAEEVRGTADRLGFCGTDSAAGGGSGPSSEPSCPARGRANTQRTGGGMSSLETVERATSPGLTTKKAPFIEEAQAHGQLYITQPYELYSEENQETWRRLISRQKARWEKYANQRFLDGLDILQLDWQGVPRLEDINKFMAPRTGFRAKPVSGYIPAYIFFDCLTNREFPTTITIRDGSSLDYLPEPDIFHDVAGHVPMHTDPAFADALVRFGACAQTAAEIVSGIRDEHERLRRLTSIVQALARFFWFTVEFGLMKGGKPGELKVYGSGLLSSYGEIAHCVESPDVQRYPVQLEWVINQYFEIDHYQPLLFVVDSFDHLFDLVGELEKWMKDGRLNNVSGGEPHISEADLASFLNAGVA
jgi:phenylalanine-4-hydroxylase